MPLFLCGALLPGVGRTFIDEKREKSHLNIKDVETYKSVEEATLSLHPYGCFVSSSAKFLCENRC